MKQAQLKPKIIYLSVLTVWVVLCILFLCNPPSERILSILAKTYVPLQSEMQAFETFHFSFLILAVLLAVAVLLLSIRFQKKLTKQRIDNIVFLCGVLFAFAELYKQVVSYWMLGEGIYPIQLLPLQFCSLPIYFCLIAPLLPQKAKSFFYSFLGLFGTVGGYLVLGFPNFPESLTMCVYTMLWHTLMILLGIFLLTTPYVGNRYWKELFGGGIVLAAVLAVATFCNIKLRPLGSINLFYMSPYEKPTYLIVRKVYAAFGWFPSLLTYWMMFLFMGATPLYLLSKFFKIIKMHSKNEKTEK